MRFAPGRARGRALPAQGARDRSEERQGRVPPRARCCARAQRWPDLASCSTSAPMSRPPSRRRSRRCSRSRSSSRDAARRCPSVRRRAVKRVLVLDPAQPQALRAVDRRCSRRRRTGRRWSQTYQAALKARRDVEDLGMLLQIAMVLWKHLGELDQAEEYFRRVRKLEPAHPAALDFYRAYYPAKGENQKLLAMLRQVEKAARAAQRQRRDRATDRHRDRASSPRRRTTPRRRSRPGSSTCARIRRRSRRAQRSRGCTAGPRSGTRCST